MDNDGVRPGEVEVRPFFGETPGVVSGPSFAPLVHERRGTFEQWRQCRIEDGLCPRPACHATLIEGSCPVCGWRVADERPVGWTPESEPEYVPTLPLALTLDDLEAA